MRTTIYPRNLGMASEGVWNTEIIPRVREVPLCASVWAPHLLFGLDADNDLFALYGDGVWNIVINPRVREDPVSVMVRAPHLLFGLDADNDLLAHFGDGA
jgi:hypothetical protein